MTEEQIKAMLDGLNGVTSGPWEVAQTLSCGLHVRIAKRVGDTAISPIACDLEDVTDAAHIARCDPDTIKTLCELALKGLEK